MIFFNGQIFENVTELFQILFDIFSELELFGKLFYFLP